MSPPFALKYGWVWRLSQDIYDNQKMHKLLSKLTS